MNKTLIPLEDFKRISSTIYSILLSENAEIGKSCTYFSVLGSLILKKHYNIDSQVVVGSAAYLLDAADMNVLLFAEAGENGFISTEEGFHSWIETEEWHIDFSSPLFPEMCRNAGMSISCKPKMFQKMKSSMAASGLDLKVDGDFIVSGDYELTQKMINIFTSYQVNLDIAQFCCDWYRRPPGRMAESIAIKDEMGKVKKLAFNEFRFSSAW